LFAERSSVREEYVFDDESGSGDPAVIIPMGAIGGADDDVPEVREFLGGEDVDGLFTRGDRFGL
jgi:hypothetical protein